MIKFHEKYFIQSIPYDQVHPSRRQSSNFRNIHNIENKLTRFQIYQETELACKYRNPLHKTQYSEILVEYEKDHWKSKNRPIRHKSPYKRRNIIHTS